MVPKMDLFRVVAGCIKIYSLQQISLSNQFIFKNKYVFVNLPCTVPFRRFAFDALQPVFCYQYCMCCLSVMLGGIMRRLAGCLSECAFVTVSIYWPTRCFCLADLFQSDQTYTLWSGERQITRYITLVCLF